jgi:SAM-dependent methyltransferase
MPGQQDIINAMLERIKPKGVHRIDSGLAEILTAIAENKKDTLDQKFTQLKEELNKHREDRPVDYDLHFLPYITHYIPKNYAKVQNTLLELLRKDLLPDELSIYEIGSGPGTTAFAAANFFTHLSEVEKIHKSRQKQRKVTISSSEKYENNREAFKWLRDRYYAKNAYAKKNITIHDPFEKIVTDAITIKKGSEESIDIVMMSNILSEMQDDFQKTIKAVSKIVKKDGSFVLIETADVVATNKINRAKYVLKNEGFDIYAPTAIWSPCCEFVDTKKYEQCGWGCYGDCTYCCITKPDIQKLKYPGQSPASDMKYSFWIMRKDGISLFPGIPEGYSKLNGISPGRHNIQVIKQREKTGKYEFKEVQGRSCQVYFCCDGTCGRDYAQLIPYDYEIQHEVVSANDGDILDINNALIQQNEIGYANRDVILDDESKIKVIQNTL